MKNDSTYDAALVLGSGIKEDGAIPESAKARTRKAIELFDSGKVKHVIFSGKWTYQINYTPPTTEAEAMAEYGQSLGLSKSAIEIERESITTVSNFCYIKRILEDKGWKKVILIANKPYEKRAFYNMQMVLGPEYNYEYALADFRFPPEKEKEFEKTEEQKLKNAVAFYKSMFDKGVRPGDDQIICQIAMKDLEENYRKRTN